MLEPGNNVILKIANEKYKWISKRFQFNETQFNADYFLS